MQEALDSSDFQKSRSYHHEITSQSQCNALCHAQVIGVDTLIAFRRVEFHLVTAACLRAKIYKALTKKLLAI